MGALAILGYDTSGIAAQSIPYTVAKAKTVCIDGPSADGTWDGQLTTRISG
jgi:hypothetical protein